MKALIQRILQNILGYKRYLWYFTLYKLKTLKWDKNENDFFFFLNQIKPNSLVLDIGANLGLMAYHLSRRNTVFAFEPMPDNIATIQRVRDQFNLTSLTVLPYALGNESKNIQLVLPEVDGVKKQGLSHVVDEKMTEFNAGILFEAKCYKLDEVKELENCKIDAIKIDVENFEFEVFQGAENILKRDKPIIYCELWNNKNRIDCFTFLENLGYATHILKNNVLTKIDSNPSDIQNFFFLPKHP